MWSRHSARTVLTQHSAYAFAWGVRTGVGMILVPSVRKTSSNGPAYLASRSRMRNRGAALSGNLRKRFRACWASQLASGWAVDLAHHATTPNLYGEEHVEGPKP